MVVSYTQNFENGISEAIWCIHAHRTLNDTDNDEFTYMAIAVCIHTRFAA